jgi:hypothetical protein
MVRRRSGVALEVWRLPAEPQPSTGLSAARADPDSPAARLSHRRICLNFVVTHCDFRTNVDRLIERRGHRLAGMDDGHRQNG